MLSLIGKDRPGIVARVSAALCQAGCNLGDSSMARLGQNFTIMVMVQSQGDADRLLHIVKPIGHELELAHHIHPVAGGMEHNVEPDVRVSVYAPDRPGIIEDVSRVLAEAGLNILHLDSNIGVEKSSPTYYIHIEGTVSQGMDPLYQALEHLSRDKKMSTQLVPINPDLS